MAAAGPTGNGGRAAGGWGYAGSLSLVRRRGGAGERWMSAGRMVGVFSARVFCVCVLDVTQRTPRDADQIRQSLRRALRSEKYFRAARNCSKSLWRRARRFANQECVVSVLDMHSEKLIEHDISDHDVPAISKGGKPQTLLLRIASHL
jgi:hypothetical protein